MRLGRDKADIFAEWAWGEDFFRMNISNDAVDLWNERHGEIYRCEISNTVVDDLTKMIDLWEEHTCKG